MTKGGLHKPTGEIRGFMKKHLFAIEILVVLLIFWFVLSGCEIHVSGVYGEAPGSPFITANYDRHSTTLNWKAVWGATGYDIYYAPRSGSVDPCTYTKLYSTTNTSYTHHTLTNYRYAVKAYNSYGTSEFSNVVYP